MNAATATCIFTAELASERILVIGQYLIKL